MFLTFVVVVGTLLLHGLTLPWLIRVLDVQGDDAQQDAARGRRPRTGRRGRPPTGSTSCWPRIAGPSDVHRARRRGAARTGTPGASTRAWERLGRTDEEIGESPAAAFRRLRLEMLAAERETFIAERDAGHIDDEVLRSMLHGLDLEEATLNRK